MVFQTQAEIYATSPRMNVEDMLDHARCMQET